MVESTHKTYIDKRTEEEKQAGLAIPILFWYDTDHKGRTRTNGVSMTHDGQLIVGRSTCSKKDHFNKKKGRMVVVQRILGRAKRHCYVVDMNMMNLEGNTTAERAASAYVRTLGDDERGRGRAYNAGSTFTRFQNHLQDVI